MDKMNDALRQMVHLQVHVKIYSELTKFTFFISHFSFIFKNYNKSMFGKSKNGIQQGALAIKKGTI